MIFNFLFSLSILNMPIVSLRPDKASEPVKSIFLLFGETSSFEYLGPLVKPTMAS